jgi:alginate O-acetyltransferase complex protein AlgJ
MMAAPDERACPPAAPLRARHRLYAGALILLSGAGLLYETSVLLQAPAATLKPARAHWLDGSNRRALTKALTLPSREQLDTAAAALRYRFFGDLGAQVREGCPGWLFYAAGLRVQTGAQAGAQAAFGQRLALMRSVVRTLRASGIEVIVLTVPDKSRIERAALCGLRQADDMQLRWQRWQANLAAEGVRVDDLEAALAAVKPAFFRTDVHWNQRGAAAAATLVAAKVRPLLPKAAAQQFTRHAAARAQERVGDLLVLAGLDQAAPRWRPPFDVEAPETIMAMAKGGLLDEPTPPAVMVLGSSYSRRSNFVESLAMALARDVWNRSVDGGEFAGALRAALQERARWPASTHVVIWELPELALSLPLGEAEQALLHDTIKGTALTAAAR